jgi:hypothetical protein
MPWRTVASDNFDPHGNRGRIKHPDNKTFVYAFDDRDRLYYLTENGTSATLASILFDEQGRREQVDREKWTRFLGQFSRSG